jgi:predicted O-linked N-acetylglucosamine transferase (SPINDLY family)
MLRAFLDSLFGRRAAASPPLAEGDRLLEAGQPAAALDAYERALAAKPDSGAAELGRAAALFDLWRVDEGVAAYARAHVLQPASPAAHSAWLFHLHYPADAEAGALAAAHRTYGARFPAPAAPARTDPAPERRLRIGYLSPNFSRHSVGYFVAPVLEHHDRAAFESTCYYLHPRSDDATARMRGFAGRWRDTAGWDDDRLERAIRDDGIDVLVDLAGHTKLNRLPVMARKPAPVQVTWLGYPDTTGLTAIGYRITDAIADPPGAADGRHTEKLVRLPGPMLCYRPPEDAPPVAAPAARDGGVVFGSFNNTDKLSTAAVALWSRVLAAVPGSRLLLKSARAGVPEAVERMHTAFAAHGIAAARIRLAPWRERRADHLAAYADVDVALDTFPYNGTTTTCEALWMGTPVVTLAGAMHMARVGASLLTHAGLPELVAADEAGFVAAAVALAHDGARRDALRKSLRDRLGASPLMDARAHTKNLEAAYRELWRGWCTAEA